MTILNDTAPKRIWLCVSDDTDDNDKPYPELYAEDAEITWSTDQPVAVTVEYVRVDLSDIAKLRAERDALADEARDLDVELTRARAERNNWHVAAEIELAKAITAKVDLAAARALLREVLDCDQQAIPDWLTNDINAALAGDKP